MDRISLYWKNASAEAVGEKHGVSEKELKHAAPRIKALTKQMADDRKAGNLKYRDFPYDENMVDAVNREVEHFRDRCEILIVLGVGGAAPGNIALHGALNPCTYNLMSDRTRPGPQLFVLDDVDPDHIRSVVELVTPRIKKTIVNVVSQAGETAQTAAQFILFRDLLQSKLGKKYRENILATTDPAGGALREVCNAEGYRSLEVPGGVRGRFTVMSAIGLFSAAVCGIDIDALLEGAADMDKRLKDGDVLANPAALLAAVHYVLGGKGKPVSVMTPYSTSLYSLADWFRQLWDQSLGGQNGPSMKNVFIGRTSVDAPETTDPRVQVRLDREGPNDKVITFLEVERFAQKVSIPSSLKGVQTLGYLAGSNFQALIHGEKSATEYALRESQRPTMTVLFPQLSPRAVGQFLYLYEAAVGYLGGLLDLDPHGRADIQPGKNATHPLMGSPGFADLASSVQPAAKRDSKYLI